MQGLQSLNEFKNFVSKIGGLGRYEDTYIVHAAEGETVVPMEVLDQTPVLKKRLFKTMMEMGIEPGRYIVGNELNSKNPVTGQPEFFFKQIGRRLRKAAADISGYAAPIVGAMFGAPAGAATGALLGQYKRENPGDPTQGLNMALRGGLAGVASNIATGNPNILTGRGAYDLYGKGLGKFDVAGLGKRMLGVGDMGSYDGPTGLGSFLKDSSGDYRSSILQKFLGSSPQDKELATIIEKVEDKIATKDDLSRLKEIVDTKELLEKAGVGPAGSKFKEVILPYLAANLGLGFLIDQTTDEQDIGLPADTMPEGNVLQGIINPKYKAQGGVMDLQDGGESKGPGTGTSDSIPAMLSEGEFVMTAKAVRGAGGGDRREGARKMYEAMDRLEASA